MNWNWFRRLLVKLRLLPPGGIAPAVVLDPWPSIGEDAVIIEGQDWFAITDLEELRALNVRASEHVTDGMRAALYFGTTFGTKPQRDLAIRLMESRKRREENQLYKG